MSRSMRGKHAGRWLPLLLATLSAGSLASAPEPPSLLALRSRTGQFVVYGPAPKDSTLLQPAPKSQAVLELNTALLVVTAERIKTALLSELGLGDQFRSTIHLVLDPAAASRDVLITSTLSSDGWRYSVQLPPEIESAKLVRAIVSVLLQEFADRAAGGKAAEIPLWLKEGLAFHLLNYAALNLTLQTESIIVHEAKKADGFAQLREDLRDKQPLTLQQLSFPAPSDLTGDNLKFYQACAQLFLFDLLQLPGGREAIVNTIRNLPRYLNWQFAFLHAFQGQFHDLIDVEKWWALNALHFSGRSEAQSWSPEAAGRKLNELLRVYPALKDSAPSSDRYLTLQEIAAQWGFAEQKQLFQSKVKELAVLRPNVPREYAPLVDAYRGALERYLARRERAGFASNRPGHYYGNVSGTVDELTKELNGLDARRAVLSRRGEVVP